MHYWIQNITKYYDMTTNESKKKKWTQISKDKRKNIFDIYWTYIVVSTYRSS
jgi:hypothetical protein